MSQILEIPDPVYHALIQAAKQSGTTPAEWIAAHLPLQARENGEPPQPEKPAEATPDSEDELADARPWRGTYAPNIPREILFTQEMEFNTADLPRWSPSVTVDPRRLEADDE